MAPGRLLTAVVVVVVVAGCSTAPVPTTSGNGPAAGDDTPVGTASPAAPNGTLEVHFINVGQSVATLVVGPEGETMLIDSGHYRDDGEHVLSYLQARGVERIDYLVTSHADADHVGGHAAVIEYFETEADGIGAVYDPGITSSTQTYAAYLDAVERHDVTLYETREGDAIPMAGVDVDVLGPPDPYLDGGDRNENSLVLRVGFGASRFLFTGDAEADGESHLVEEYGEDLDATVLKAGHHGSSSSTGAALLAAADPQAVLVSSAYDSQYGHPHEETLRRLADRDVPTYWTATHGDVVLVSDGSEVQVRTQRAAPTDPLRLREGDPVAPGTGDPVDLRAVIDARGGVATVDAPTGTATATDGGTPVGPLEVSAIHEDAAGDDRENLNDEYVVFENAGDEPLDLSGWTVSDEAGRTYTFPDGFELAPGERVTLHTGAGADTATDLYWGAGGPVWNNDGDTVVVRTDDGDVVLQESY
ncbi:MAG: lamin tail domain-containing protein [Halobacteriales archaeon]